MKRLLVLVLGIAAGFAACAADADATGIVPKLAISFNDKTLTSVGSVTMEGQTSVSSDKFVDGTNGYALDMGAVGSAVTLYNSGNRNTTLSGTKADPSSGSPFAISYFGTVATTSSAVLMQSQYYQDHRGVMLLFKSNGDFEYAWKGDYSWGENTISVPVNHDWTQPHHYVFSFGDVQNGTMRFYVDGIFVCEVAPLNNGKNKAADSVGYRNPAGKGYYQLYVGNAFGISGSTCAAGVVDDVRYYADPSASISIEGSTSDAKYVLSDAMVQKLYRSLIGDDAVVKIRTAGYDSLAAALAVVQPGQTLTLNDNIVLTESAAIPAGVDIEFGTYTITTTTEGVALTATSDIYEIASETTGDVTTFSKTYLDNVVVWNGATGASWGTAGNWLVKGEAATAVPSASDTVVFPAHIDSARTFVMDAAVSAGTVLVNGKYAISGSAALTASTLKVSGSGEFTIASAAAYTGAIAVDGTSGVVRVDVGDDVAYTIGTLSLVDAPSDIDNRKCYLYIDSGDVSFSNICRIHTQIATGAKVNVTANFGSYGSGYFAWFGGTGDLVFDGATLNMTGRGDYGSVISKFAGTLTLTNNASVTFSNNNNSNPANALGTGKVVLAGCSMSGGNTGGSGYVFGNTSIEVVAGTVNNCTSTFALPLDKVLVTGGSAELTRAQRTVLTTTNGTMTTGASISDETKALGWKVRTVANTVELYKSGFSLVIR